MRRRSRRRIPLKEVQKALIFVDMLEQSQEVETIKACLEAFLPPTPSDSDDKKKNDAAPEQGRQANDDQAKPIKRRMKRRNYTAKDYPNAPREAIDHEDLKAGDPCPDCASAGLKTGKLYPMEPASFMHWMGQLPLMLKIYLLARLRCSGCQKVFTAQCPGHTKHQKYSSSAKAMVALLKYGLGFPYYRQSRLQETLGMKLPASSLYRIVLELYQDVHPIIEAMKRHACDNAKQVMIDDTHFPILDLIYENKREPNRKRLGMRVTAMRVTDTEDRILHLFLPGRNHAGENMDLLFAKRDPKRWLTQICDALAANQDHQVNSQVAHCWSHALRRFQGQARDPDAAYVLHQIGQLYQADERCREHGIVGRHRRNYHRVHSQPICRRLKTWINAKFHEKHIEPSSRLGSDLQYILNHWKGFTRFLDHPGIPLDNNRCEQIVKEIITQRKNSLFFKTCEGAEVGAGLTSILSTCQALGINPFEYLVDLQDQASDVAKQPEAWLPWAWQERNQTQAMPTTA